MYTFQSGYTSLHFWRLPSDIESYWRDISFAFLTFDSFLLFTVNSTLCTHVKYLICTCCFTILVSRVEICQSRIMIRYKLLASRFIVIPHTKRVNMGCKMHFVLTECLDLYFMKYFCEMDSYQNCKHSWWGIIMRNVRRVHRFILCKIYMMFTLGLYPPPVFYMMQLCTVLFAVA